MNLITKRNGEKQEFNFSKIENAVRSAFAAKEKKLTDDEQSIELILRVIKNSIDILFTKGEVTVESIQDCVEKALMSCGQYDVAKSYILYREKHKDLRYIKERVDWIDKYISSSENAATSSETDANANVSIKNVANIDGEVYKSLNRQIQRYRMRKQLEKQFPEVAKQYELDLEHHIIYAHDEASSPAIKNYCEAVSLYPLLVEGTKGMDGLGTTSPKNLNSFCGQLVNLTFLLSAQCKGAVAFGEFFNFLEYFCVKDFGENFYINAESTVATLKPKRTVLEAIHQAYQQIVYGWNQPAGNRSYQSPSK